MVRSLTRRAVAATSPNQASPRSISRATGSSAPNHRIAGVHGAAVGGGLGLAMVADFRVTCPGGALCANFTRLGFHPGFGLTVTLPAAIGETKGALMFYTSRRVSGEEAYAMGLADVQVPQDQDSRRRDQARYRDRREFAARTLSPRG